MILIQLSVFKPYYISLSHEFNAIVCFQTLPYEVSHDFDTIVCFQTLPYKVQVMILIQ